MRSGLDPTADKLSLSHDLQVFYPQYLNNEPNRILASQGQHALFRSKMENAICSSQRLGGFEASGLLREVLSGEIEDMDTEDTLEHILTR